ncbi:MAG: ABC transporter ATP-binding protein [Gemmatimonadota bacterium]
MTITLDVRDLWVLFAGPPRPSVIDGSRTALLVEPSMEASLPAGHRIGLPGVTFTVNGGECLAVLGTSGAGKSSLLRTLAGLQPAARGTVLVSGREVTALPPERRGIVYLHQEPVLFPHLTVMDNVAFPLTVRGMPKREAQRRAVEMLRRLRVGELAVNAATALSGGQRHRVALARALCADPAVLLLDEPLSSLDPAVRRDVRTALLQAREVSGAATILVTHDLDDAMAVATHVSTIGRYGELSVPTAPAELLHAPPTLTAAQLLGVYAELAGVVEQEAGRSRFRWLGGVIDASGLEPGPTIACVRSHELEVHTAGTQASPVLSVMARRDAAHEVLLDLRDAAGATVTVRAPSHTRATLGDAVQVVVRHARFFPTH